MLRAGRDLAANIFQHHFALDDAKRALVHRHDGTVTTQMLAAPACLDVAHDAGAAVGQGEMRVLFQRRQVAAIGHQEILTGERDLGLNLREPRAGRASLQAAGQAQQPLLKLSPQDRTDAQPTQQAGIDRGVQSESAQMGGGVECPDPLQGAHCDPRGGVHGQIKGDQPGGAYRLFVQRLSREVQRSSLEAVSA